MKVLSLLEEYGTKVKTPRQDRSLTDRALALALEGELSYCCPVTLLAFFRMLVQRGRGSLLPSWRDPFEKPSLCYIKGTCPNLSFSSSIFLSALLQVSNDHVSSFISVFISSQLDPQGQLLLSLLSLTIHFGFESRGFNRNSYHSLANLQWSPALRCNSFRAFISESLPIDRIDALVDDGRQQESKTACWVLETSEDSHQRSPSLDSQCTCLWR